MKIYRNALYRLYRIVSKSISLKKQTVPVSVYAKQDGNDLVLTTFFENAAGTLTIVSIKHPIIDEVVESQINMNALTDVVKGATKQNDLDVVTVCESNAVQSDDVESKLKWNVKGIEKYVESTVRKKNCFDIKRPEDKEIATYDQNLTRYFKEAFQCVDLDHSKYALGGVLVDGDSGALVATDGRHCYAQSGLIFPFEGQYVFPFFAASFLEEEVKTITSFQFGLESSNRFYLAYGDIEMNANVLEGRFPRWKKVVDFEDAEKSSMKKVVMSEDDAHKLTELVDDLPNDCYEIKSDNKDNPIFIHALDKMRLRAFDCKSKTGVEVILSGSTATMDHVEYSTSINRDFFKNALKFGFRSFYMAQHTEHKSSKPGAERYENGPIYFVDNESQSRYVVMSLSCFSELEGAKISTMKIPQEDTETPPGKPKKWGETASKKTGAQKEAARGEKPFRTPEKGLKIDFPAPSTDPGTVFAMTHAIVLKREKLLIAVMRGEKVYHAGQVYYRYYTQPVLFRRQAARQAPRPRRPGRTTRIRSKHLLQGMRERPRSLLPLERSLWLEP